MKLQTIIEIKKRIDYAHESYFNSNAKSARITQLYTYLMRVHDEVKSEPRFHETVNLKARETLNHPKASRSCKKTMQKWLDEYACEEPVTQVYKRRKMN